MKGFRIQYNNSTRGVIKTFIAQNNKLFQYKGRYNSDNRYNPEIYKKNLENMEKKLEELNARIKAGEKVYTKIPFPKFIKKFFEDEEKYGPSPY